MIKILKENIYIFYRLMKASLGRCLYYLCWLIPINKNKIVFSSFDGKQGYGCNPKYIAEELIRRNSDRPSSTQYKLIWLVNDINKVFPDKIKKKKNSFLNRVYHLSTARVWIDNVRKPLDTMKRRKQLYIATWHGAIGFKPVGKLRGKSFPKIAYLVSKHDSELVDYFLSNSEWCSNIYRTAFFYNGKILKSGSPRCDVLINKKEGLYEKIRSEYNIPVDSKILMYAPTFRSGNQNTLRKVISNSINIDFLKLVKAMEQKFQGKWYVFLRLHPTLATEASCLCFKNDGYIIDVTDRDDIYEVLAVSDAFISDYSSMVFDAALMKIPIFIYAYDINEYASDRGALLWDLNKLPFQFSHNNDELVETILSFDYNRYTRALTDFFNKVGLAEDGHASERVADLIDEFILGKGKQNNAAESDIRVV